MAAELVACEASRFLEELPQEELKWEGVGQKLSEEEKKTRGKAHIANLKAMLSGGG